VRIINLGQVCYAAGRLRRNRTVSEFTPPSETTIGTYRLVINNASDARLEGPTTTKKPVKLEYLGSAGLPLAPHETNPRPIKMFKRMERSIDTCKD